jgi:hypothetical protein
MDCVITPSAFRMAVAHCRCRSAGVYGSGADKRGEEAPPSTEEHKKTRRNRPNKIN